MMAVSFFNLTAIIGNTYFGGIMSEIEVQAECYRLIKQNQELSNLLQQAMQKVGAANVQEFFEKLPEVKVNDSVTE